MAVCRVLTPKVDAILMISSSDVACGARVEDVAQLGISIAHGVRVDPT